MRQDKASTSKIIFWLLLIVFLWIGVTHFAETQHILEVLTSGKWYWIGAAVICQLFFYPIYVSFVQSVFKIFDLKLRRKKILPIYIASKFTDVALPIASAGKIAVFIRNGAKYGVKALDMGIAVFFVFLAEVTGFAIIALFGLLVLFLFGKPLTFVSVAFLILLALVSLAILLLIRTAIFERPLNRPMRWLIKFIARIAGKGDVHLDEIGIISLQAGSKLRHNKRFILSSLKWSIFTHFLNLLTFAFIFLAFAGQVNFLAILAGYVAGLLFTIVSITPQGVGVAETVMITTLHSFGLDISEAAVITLAYRGLLYWLPLFPGFYFFSHLELKK